MEVKDLHLMPRFLLGSTIFVLLTVIFFLLCVGVTSVFSFWLVRRRKRRLTEEAQMKEMDTFSKPGNAFMEITSECEALLGSKVVNLRTPVLCEVDTRF